MINNQITWWMSVQMYCEFENPYLLCIFFDHGYLTYYSTYLFENLYVHCWVIRSGLTQNLEPVRDKGLFPTPDPVIGP